MKCQFCEKPATFHITELTEPNGPQVMHLCEEHARGFLQKEAVNPSRFDRRSLGQTTEFGPNQGGIG